MKTPNRTRLWFQPPTKRGPTVLWVIVVMLVLGLTACGGADKEEETPSPEDAQTGTVTAADVGPVERVELGSIDAELAQQGEQLFQTRCTVCHRMGERYVGPDLTQTAEVRDPVYIMNMVLNPEGMIQNHPTAQALMAEYGTIMTNQNLSQEQARAILEYLRQVAEEATAAP